MLEHAISAEGLRKSYGDVHALRGVDLAVPAATILGLLGPNGAGKTTAVRILTTLLRPDAGTARVAGHDVLHQPDAVRAAIGLTGQYAAVDENLTGRENLEMVGRLLHLGRPTARARADELLATFDLTDAGRRPARTYSGGMRRRLDLAASLVGRPVVLFLDEPTTGLDPASRLGLWEVIEGLVADGTTILLTTQYLEEADRLADRIAVIDGGAVIAEGTASELKDRLGEDVVDLRIVDRPAPTPRWSSSGRSRPPSHAPTPGSGRHQPARPPRRRDPRRGRPPHRRRRPRGRRALPPPPEPRRRLPVPHRTPGRGRPPAPRRGACRRRDGPPPLRPAGEEERRMTRRPARQPRSAVPPAGRRSPTLDRHRLDHDRLAVTCWRSSGTPSSSWSTRSRRSCSCCSSRSSSAGRSRRPAIDYITFLMPGIFVQTVVFGGHEHRRRAGRGPPEGDHRPLPVAADGAVGGPDRQDDRRPHAQRLHRRDHDGGRLPHRLPLHRHVPEFVLALVLITLFGYSISWLSANIGLRAKSAQAAQGAIFIPVFPLTFLSSAFVPVATMPEWLQPIAEANPVTVVVNAARGLIVGAPNRRTRSSSRRLDRRPRRRLRPARDLDRTAARDRMRQPSRDGTVPTWIVTIPPDMPIQRTPTRPASRMTSAIRSGRRVALHAAHEVRVGVALAGDPPDEGHDPVEPPAHDPGEAAARAGDLQADDLAARAARRAPSPRSLACSRAGCASRRRSSRRRSDRRRPAAPSRHPRRTSARAGPRTAAGRSRSCPG